MSSVAHITKKPPSIPPLRNGDHLTVAEFERRYEAMPHVKKAELIEGVVYMPSPVTMELQGTSAQPAWRFCQIPGFCLVVGGSGRFSQSLLVSASR